jgi:hypothetical protein
MVLSRFWLVIFISSLVFILVGISFNQQYSIDSVINGKQNDPILIGEKYLFQLPNALKDTLKKTPEGTLVFNLNEADADTTYQLTDGQVKIFSGVQKTDGLLPTAKSTILALCCRWKEWNGVRSSWVAVVMVVLAWGASIVDARPVTGLPHGGMLHPCPSGARPPASPTR